MKRVPVFLLIILVTSFAFALQPNYVKSTVFNVDDASSNIESTTYSDGLGRQIQSKAKINGAADRTTCTFFDEAGRPEFSTKIFIDNQSPGQYLGTSFTDLNLAPNGQLFKQYNDAISYSTTKYSEDPLSRTIEGNAPGQDFSAYPAKTWYFGVGKDPRTVTVEGVDFIFADGLITTYINDNNFDAKLVGLTNHFLDNPWPNADHFLTVSKSYVNDPAPAITSHPVYTQELKDLAGKTVATRSMVSPTKTITAKYGFDVLGNLLTEIAPVNPAAPIAATTYTYNTLGQLTMKSSPDAGCVKYGYTASGQLEYDTSYNAATDWIYRIRKYTYDDFGRPLTIELYLSNYGSEHFTPVVLNYYDDINAVRGEPAKKYGISDQQLSSLANLRGRLVASVAVNLTSQGAYYVCDIFSYSNEGMVSSKVKIVPGISPQTISYGYDIHGKIMSDTTRCGSTAIIKNYVYDAEARLIRVINKSDGNPGKTIAEYTYDQLGRLQSKNFAIGAPPGRSIYFAYNIREWIESITTPGPVKSFSESIYQYAPTGNILRAHYTYKITAPALQYNRTYSYDNVNRLAEVTPTGGGTDNYSCSYTYDALGRFTSKQEGAKTLPTYHYFANTNRLKHTTGHDADTTYMYDKNGNMVIDKAKKMVIDYDWRDLPKEFLFYNTLPLAPFIEAAADGEYLAGGTEGGLSDYIEDYALNSGGTINLLSKVVMLYDAAGNRVLKMEGK